MPALRAGWLTQTFLHWSYAPELIQRLLPDGLTVDTYDGHAWVGLTPFVMADVRPPGSPVALAAFPETNLRTYVRGPGGREGLWFLSIEVACPGQTSSEPARRWCAAGRVRTSASSAADVRAGAPARLLRPHCGPAADLFHEQKRLVGAVVAWAGDMSTHCCRLWSVMCSAESRTWSATVPA
ncbi:DUF2071 domain-containing protein [Streptomyces cinerochromogenes]|uniref:DUF2071 domain-containing protein n=1 Tax=Streptomyces cinerochromogenes TaxID=66422 RepID=A0ABW7BEM7_9ACTN